MDDVETTHNSLQGSTDLVLSSQWVEAGNRRREAVRAAHDQSQVTLLSLLDHYMTLKSAAKAAVSPDTRRLYHLGVRRFLEFAAGRDGPNTRLELTRCDVDDIERWQVSLQQVGLSANSVSSYLYGVRALYRALKWAGAADENPAAAAKPPRERTPAHARKGALPVNVYRRLLDLPAERYGADDPRRVRDAALLALGGSAGLRAAEICGLNIPDIELTLHRLVVRFGKGGKRRLVPLSGQLEGVLAAWLTVRSALVLRGQAREDEPALLVSLSSNASLGRRLTPAGGRFIAAGYYRLLGLPPEMWGLHTLRRTAGTHLYRATRDLYVVADVLGHSSVNTSAIYAKMDLESRREAVQAMEDLRDREENLP